MYCKYCGKKNPESSKFCQSCGNGIGIIQHTDKPLIEETRISKKYIDQDTNPYPYVISTWKLTIMCVSTFGIYEIYWFYKQWKSFNSENKLNHNNFVLLIFALFAPLSCFSLFKHISNNFNGLNRRKSFEAGPLAFVYFFLTRFLMGFLVLIPIQKKINTYWEHEYGEKLEKSRFGLGNLIMVLGIIVIIIFWASSEDTTSSPDVITATPIDTTSSEIPPTLAGNTYDQNLIVSSVVNIFCPSTVNGDDSSGGSGTIINEDGTILTNSHVIPQDETDLLVDEKGCLVVLPDPETGESNEIYWAHPFVIPGLSDSYDLAYMLIYSAYYDEDEQKYLGHYPQKFPAFDDTTRCTNENVKLGESVRVFGYPSISGGFSLTITDGIVSSFPGDGLIVTSAKISHGNSGGLAVDKNGCMLGVPSLVNSDDSESLGVLYSVDLINEFSSEAANYIDKNL